jgi:cytochrome c-type biogenesis protein CcmH
LEAGLYVLIWTILACLTAIVLFILLRPLAGGDAGEPARDAFDAAVYRDQLGEIERDSARGLIGEPEAEAARIEIARRLLAADSREDAQDPGSTAGVAARAAMVVVAVAVPLAAIGLYLAYGSPRLSDQPLAARLSDPASDQNFGALIAKVEARLREHPEEGQGWDVIAPIYLGLGRYSDAADAYENAIRLLGESPKRLSGEGQALVLQHDGVVTEDARRALERALELDRTLTEPRTLLAIAKEQDGKFAAAIEDWRGLLASGDGNAPWREMVEKRIGAAEAKLAGNAPSSEEPPSAGGPRNERGPNSADIAVAESMSPAERQAMVEGMVQGLAARLEEKSDDLGGWLKLVRAYAMLDRKDDAQHALQRAKNQFNGDAQAIQQLDALATELGLNS